MFKNWFKWETKADKFESASFMIIILAAFFTVVGISVGTFIPGFPVALAIVGAFLVLVGIVFYVISEFTRIWENREK